MNKYQNNVLEDGIVIHYDEEKNAIITFSNFELFLKAFPSSRYLLKEKQVGKYNIVDIETESDSINLKKYKELATLDNILNKISISRINSTPRCYEYEIFNTKKTIIKNTISLDVLESLNDEFFQQLHYINERLSALNKPQLELEKSFLVKSIEDVLKQKNLTQSITYDDLVNCFNEICEEHELLQKAYMDSLDTNTIKFDYQKKTQEVNDKLQTILSDIQNKLLIPPLGLIITLANIYDKPPLIKSLTMLVLFFFFVLVGIYAYNQYKILDNYLSTIEHWKNFYIKFLSKNFKKVAGDFKNISKIASSIQHTIVITSVINFILYIIAFAFIF